MVCRLGVDCRRCKLGHSLDLHVTAPEQPLVILLDHTAPISRVMMTSLGKMPTTSPRRLTSVLRCSSGLVLCNLVGCWAGKAR